MPFNAERGGSLSEARFKHTSRRMRTISMGRARLTLAAAKAPT
jgi:hypothetical protein